MFERAFGALFERAFETALLGKLPAVGVCAVFRNI